MDTIEELLPGLEEFLTITLATENLSNFAEERRQFFIERLDIIKLPPTLPPREGRVLPPELLKETEQVSGIPAHHNAPDFAATQREISRSYIDSSLCTDDVTDGAEPSSDKGVKDYDDIDPADSGKEQTPASRPRPLSDIIPNKISDDDILDNEENALYEIPVARQQLSPESNSQSFGADGSSITTAGSTEELPDDVLDSTLVLPPAVPPPLPPRRDIKFSDSGSRNSINFDDKPPELPFRPPLPKRNELYTRSDKSDRSDKSNNSDLELSGDGDSTSYESFEEDEQPDTDLTNKLNIQLPKKHKKRMALKKSKKLSKSRSSSQWEISAPFRKLENIDISGELYYRGKLKWNRRIVAISNGCIAMYKPDKDARPSLVIPLTGFEASVSEREGRRGFEVKMMHPNGEYHSFSVDFKEWALLWMEHINGNSKGLCPPKYHTHLARSFSGDADCSANTTTYGSKTDLQESTSNLSTGSEGTGEDSSKLKLKGNKVMRMGSFAFRATQFFENIGKKTTNKKKSHQNSGTNFRHSGDFTDVHDTIVEKPSVSSSNSTGNLARSKKMTTSDSNLSSVFSTSEHLFSLPPKSVADVGKHWEGAVDDDFVDVAIKGYLSIFSSFNKRRWGKRWCLVRENMFECYKSDSSQQCELNFLLKPCALRRAVEETNSENGLMILEAGREKITVEPLSKEEMGHWVRVLLNETSTPTVPQGLEEFLKEAKNADGDGSSVMSFTVLKQWDMDCLVPAKSPSAHDYEDPVETADAVAKLQARSQNESMSAVNSYTDLNNSSSCTMSQSVPVSEDDVGQINNSLPVCNKNKHTTDSGFYSAKGANSDSDSSHDVGDLEFGYAAQDSRSFYNFQHSGKLNKEVSLSSPGIEKESSLGKDFSHTDTSVSHVHSTELIEPSSSSNCAYLSHSASSLSSSSPCSPKLTISSSESRLNLTDCTSDSQNRGNKNYGYTVPPSELNLSKNPSDSASTVSKSGSSVSSSLTVLSPSGEEYSAVLKRSERSSVSPESSVGRNSSLSSASDSKSGANVNHNDGEFVSNNDNENVICQNNFSDERRYSLMTSDNESSYYEPVCARNSMDSDTTENSAHLTDAELNTIGSNNPEFSITRSSSLDSDLPPPIPTSPIPDVVTSPSFATKVTSSTTHSGELETDTRSLRTYVSKQPEISSESRKDTSSSRPGKKKPKKNLNLNTGDGAKLSGSLCPSLSNGESSAAEAGVLGTDDVFPGYESPLSPTFEVIAEVIGNPNTTPGELKDMTERLMHKQSEIKRKRLAVHDKRQRVLTDEERLVCEKEFAALEKAAETTENNIRTVQNKLDIIQGQTLETKKAAHGKHKSGSKAKKTKKKS